MVELGELERYFAEFDKRNLRVVVASLEDAEAARLTQADFPHLTVVSDPNQNLTDAFQVLHEGVYTPDDKRANAPTTFFIDGTGQVCWLFRPDRHIERLSVFQLLGAVDQHR